MSTNIPEVPEPDIQLTPVEFSPTPNPDALGTVIGAARREFQFSVFLPLSIILLTLIYTDLRDIAALNKRMDAIDKDNAPALEVLKKSGKQSEFFESIRGDVVKLSTTDPIAAQIVAEYFPAPPVKKQDGQDATPAPAK